MHFLFLFCIYRDKPDFKKKVGLTVAVGLATRFYCDTYSREQTSQPLLEGKFVYL